MYRKKRKIFLEKVCTECGTSKDIECFGDNRSGKYRKNSKCYRCKRDLMYKRLYGVGIGLFEKILKTQKGRCPLCGREFPGELYDPKVRQADRPVWDHDHLAKIPRGVLCQKCNT